MKEAHALPYFSAYDVFIILERKRTDDLRNIQSQQILEMVQYLSIYYIIHS